MTKRLRLELRAREQLDDIAIWTVRTFGPRQAKRYEDLLAGRFEKLARGLAHSKPVAPSDHRRAMAAGQHVVIFTEDTETVTILAILHSASDYLTHLIPLKDD